MSFFSHPVSCYFLDYLCTTRFKLHPLVLPSASIFQESGLGFHWMNWLEYYAKAWENHAGDWIIDSFGTIGVVLEAHATKYRQPYWGCRIQPYAVSCIGYLVAILCSVILLCYFVFLKQTLISANRNTFSCTHSSTFYWVFAPMFSASTLAPCRSGKFRTRQFVSTDSIWRHPALI